MPSPRDPTCDEATSLLQESDVSAQSNVVQESVYPRWIITVVLLCGGAVLFDLSNNLGEVAEVALLEDMVCRDYYAKHVVNAVTSAAERCKIEPIQTEIALLNGWRETFETIPGEFILEKRGVLRFSSQDSETEFWNSHTSGGAVWDSSGLGRISTRRFVGLFW